MSDVNSKDLTRINEASDVYHLYKGQGDKAKSGIEIELAFYAPETLDLDVMTKSQNEALKSCARDALPDEGDWVHNEPTSELLEIVGKPFDFAHMQDALEDINTKLGILSRQAEALGLKRSYFQELPERSANDLLTRIMDVERYQIMYAPYREDMTKCVQYFAVCKSNQVSVSHSDPDHLLKNLRRLYMLAPFLFMATENSNGFLAGQPFNGHLGMYMRYHGLTEGRGGVPPYVFTAQTGEEFISSHINHVMNNPLFMYYNREGTLTGVPSGDWSVTFNSLKERGLNTASNYYLAQSLLWPDVKIAGLKDDQDNVYGHRYEPRMFGVGIHQHQSAYLVVSALAFHDKFAEAVDELLARYGFDCNYLQQTHVRIDKAYSLARNHGGRFFNIPYGKGTMADFAKEFADLYEEMAEDIGMQDVASAFATICRTGYTDTKVNRILFPTLRAALSQQRNYDPSLFDNPNRCAYDVFDKEIKRSGCKCA